MDKNAIEALALTAAVVLLVAALASRPNCSSGCRTVLEHVAGHVLVDIVRAAFA